MSVSSSLRASGSSLKTLRSSRIAGSASRDAAALAAAAVRPTTSSSRVSGSVSLSTTADTHQRIISSDTLRDSKLRHSPRQRNCRIRPLSTSRPVPQSAHFFTPSTTFASQAAGPSSSVPRTETSRLEYGTSSSSLNGSAQESRIGSTSSETSWSSVNDSEISHFSRLSSEWWDERGEFAFLHRMNPVRVEFVREKIQQGRWDDEGWSWEKTRSGSTQSEERIDGKWLTGLKALDVGCGGGLLTESLARLGADALGIDASASNIAIATLHASQDPVFTREKNLAYRQIAVEELAKEGNQYDLVCSMEVLEHVDAPGEFLKCLGSLVKPGGHLVLSTISRTPLSQLLTITLAEHVLRQVTPGTHTYSKYIKPSELLAFARDHMGGRDVWESDGDQLVDGGKEGGGLGVGEIRGIVYNPFTSRWQLWKKGSPGGDLCNYMFHMRKRG